MTTKYTPGPWRVEEFFAEPDSYLIFDDKGATIAETLRRRNAEIIVKAWTVPILLEACRAALEFLEYDADTEAIEAIEEYRNLIHKLKTAIAAAEAYE